MAIKYMSNVNLPRYKVDKAEAWEYAESKAAAGNGNTIILPVGVKTVAVTLECTAGGEGKVQATTSLLVDALAGNEVWVDWSKGAVAATTQDALDPVTAIRLVNTAGTTKLTVRAQ